MCVCVCLFVCVFVKANMYKHWKRDRGRSCRGVHVCVCVYVRVDLFKEVILKRYFKARFSVAKRVCRKLQCSEMVLAVL